MTCPRHFEPDAGAEAERLLAGAPGGPPRARPAGMPGIVVVEGCPDPAAAVAELRRLAVSEPWEVRYIQRAIPVQEWTRTELSGIVDRARALAAGIPAGASYRVAVEKRNSSLPSRDVISGIAAGVDRRVSLGSPDYTLLVEVLGGTTGLALAAGAGILSVDRERRAASGQHGGALGEGVL